MKCPKCHYLSFDPEPRCKNCGYDLEVADADLAFRAAEDADQTLPDLPLRDEIAADEAPITLELVRSAKLVHLDDVVEEKPALRRPRVAPREPAFAGAPRRPRVAAEPPAAPAEPKRVGAPPAAPAAPSWTDFMPVGRNLEPTVTDQPAAAPAPVSRALEPEPARRTLKPHEPVAPGAPAGAERLVLAPVEPAAAPTPEPMPGPKPAPAPAPQAPSAAPAARVETGSPAPAATDLPLFIRETKGREEDLNSESPAETFMRQSGGRPPLVVRRQVESLRPSAAPPPAYVHRPERRVGPLDNDLLEDLRRVEREEAAVARAAELSARAVSAAAACDTSDLAAAPSQRLMAAALDGFLLGGIGTFVLWATLRMTGVPASAIALDAIVPLAIFLGGVGVSYLLMFTLLGGQTIGKMLAGIRVVPEDDRAERVSFRQAAARALLAPVSMAVLGLGWWPALFGRVAFHDRLVHTRVVRA